MLESDGRDFTPDWFSRPADSLLARMKRHDIDVETVAGSLDGGMETLQGLVKGSTAIDNAIASALSRSVGGTPTFWLKRQENYERALESALSKAIYDLDKWLTSVPAPGTRPRGRLSEAQKIEELRKRLVFFGVSTLPSWRARYSQLRDETQFRTSQTYPSHDGAVALWLRQGELEAALAKTDPWDPNKLKAMLSEILHLSKIRHPHRFLPKLKSICAKAGVAIVVVKAPSGCRASGASRLVTPDKAMVLLSFRHLTDDHFWFTLMHEFAHLILHGANAFVDSDDTCIDERERQANEFASSCIIPAARWEEFSNLRPDPDSILRFSVSRGIAPGLVVGQLQHRGCIPRNRLNFLKRRWKWNEVEMAIAQRANP